MVFEMYRASGGFFNLLETSIESTLGEKDLEKRENGELFEIKMALQLGRSVSELRKLASKSAAYRIEGVDIDEYNLPASSSETFFCSFMYRSHSFIFS
jgi:hypothetical protein